MVDCPQFLAGYSDYRDGQLEDAARQAFEAHRAACESCRRYDRVISHGVRTFDRYSRIEPSDDFLSRLQHRIYHLEDELRGPGRTGSGVQATLALSAAAMIAIAAWIPALRPEPGMVELPPVAARAPVPVAEVPSLYRGGPFFTPSGTAFGRWSLGAEAGAANDLMFRYSPFGSGFSVQPVSQR